MPSPSTTAPGSALAEELLFVSAGLDERGGGRAAAGRLLLASCRTLAAERGLGVRVLALGPDTGGDGVDGRAFGTSQVALAREVWRRQLARRSRVAVFDFLGAARTQAYVPAAFRVPYLVPLYGIEAWRPLGWDRVRALRGATVRLAISRYTLEEARRFTPTLGDTTVVPLAVDAAPCGSAAPDAELLRRAGSDFLLIVGRLAPGERYKGHDELIAAVAALAAGRPSLRLVIAGEGDDRERLEGLATSSGVADRVLFAGFVDPATLAELYRRCLCLAMPSRGEGFGLVYLEAMRAHRPCLAVRGTAAEEVVVDGETGMLVAAGDVAELARAIAWLLDHPVQRQRMGELGHLRWQERFRPEHFTARLAPLVDRLLGARHVRH